MKIVFTSDLHYPITHKWQLKELVENIAAENPNAVILGGDIAENLKDSQETNSFTFPHFRLCLELFTKRLTCPVLVILGNHDLWTDSPSNNSLMIWNNIGDVVKSCGAVYLEDNPQIIIDKPTNVMIIGSYLHYDYSAAEKTGVASGYDKDYWRINKHRVNNDGHYLKGLPDDIEFAGALARSLKTQLVDSEHHRGHSRSLHGAADDATASRRRLGDGYSLFRQFVLSGLHFVM